MMRQFLQMRRTEGRTFITMRLRLRLRRRWWIGRRGFCALLSEFRDYLTRVEAENDASFLEVIGGHLHFHPVSGENADAVEAHASRKMTMKLVVFRSFREDANAKGGVGEALLHNANELNHVLTHTFRVEAGKARECYRCKVAPTSPYEPKNLSVTKIVLQEFKNMLFIYFRDQSQLPHLSWRSG